MPSDCARRKRLYFVLYYARFCSLSVWRCAGATGWQRLKRPCLLYTNIYTRSENTGARAARGGRGRGRGESAGAPPRPARPRGPGRPRRGAGPRAVRGCEKNGVLLRAVLFTGRRRAARRRDQFCRLQSATDRPDTVTDRHTTRTHTHSQTQRTHVTTCHIFRLGAPSLPTVPTRETRREAECRVRTRPPVTNLAILPAARATQHSCGCAEEPLCKLLGLLGGVQLLDDLERKLQARAGPLPHSKHARCVCSC